MHIAQGPFPNIKIRSTVYPLEPNKFNTRVNFRPFWESLDNNYISSSKWIQIWKKNQRQKLVFPFWSKLEPLAVRVK